MNEPERIADQLRRVLDGDPWYGPSTLGVISGLTARQAAHRPVARAHTIWEIALHLASWNREVLRRLQTGAARDPADGDWPRPPEATEENWRWTVEALEASYRALIGAVERFPAERLDDVVREERDRPPGPGESYYVLLHGVVQHCVAHTAQLALLKKGV